MHQKKENTETLCKMCFVPFILWLPIFILIKIKQSFSISHTHARTHTHTHTHTHTDIYREKYYIIYIYIYINRYSFRSSNLGRRTANFVRASSLAEQKFLGGLNVMIPHQAKVQRLIKRGYGTSWKMVLLRISLISVASSSL